MSILQKNIPSVALALLVSFGGLALLVAGMFIGVTVEKRYSNLRVKNLQAMQCGRVMDL